MFYTLQNNNVLLFTAQQSFKLYRITTFYTLLHNKVLNLPNNKVYHRTKGYRWYWNVSVADLFEKIVPIAVYDAMNVFEGRRSQIMNMEIGRLREQTNLMNT